MQQPPADSGRERGLIHGIGRKLRIITAPESVYGIAMEQCAAPETEELAYYERQRADTYYAKTKRKAESAAFAIGEATRNNFAVSEENLIELVRKAGVIYGILTKEDARKLIGDQWERGKIIALEAINEQPQNRADKSIYYTTYENLKTEEDFLKLAQEGWELSQDGKSDNFRRECENEEIVGKIIENYKAKRKEQGKPFTANYEQLEALKFLLANQGKPIVMLDGLAGVGKTYSVEAYREIMEDAGYEIIGLAPTNQAAKNLQNSSGIRDSKSIHKFLFDLDKQSRLNAKIDNKAKAFSYAKQGERTLATLDFLNIELEPLKNGGKRQVIVVDEAATADTLLMKKLLEAAKSLKARVVVMGDASQMKPVGAGDPYSQLKDKVKIPFCSIRTIMRQKDAKLLQAVKDSATGDIFKTFEYLKESKSAKQIKDDKRRMNAIVGEAVKSSLAYYKSQLVMTMTNEERRQLNEKIRAAYMGRGEIDATKSVSVNVTYYTDSQQAAIGNGAKPKGRNEVRKLAPNDRIIFLKTDKKLGIMNGEQGTVVSIGNGELEFRFDSDKPDTPPRSISLSEYNSIDHAYAITVNKSQGLTVDKAIC